MPARDGTLRVLSAARDAGVRRVVVTSSNAAMSYGRGGRVRPFTEEDWSDIDGANDISAYEISKTIAERAAWAWHAEQGEKLEMTVINPAATLGPILSDDFSLSIEIVRALLDGSTPYLVQLGWPLVDVRDLADLHYRAMLHPNAAGHRFVGGGDFHWMSDIAAILRQELPDRARYIPTSELPGGDGALWLPNGSLHPRSFEIGKCRPVSSEKARSMLGWSTRPASGSIIDAARSLIERGLV